MHLLDKEIDITTLVGDTKGLLYIEVDGHTMADPTLEISKAILKRKFPKEIITVEKGKVTLRNFM